MSITKYKQSKIISERDQKIKMLELEKQLESKNRKLTVRALNIASRNELLKEVLQNIKEYGDLSNNKDLNKLVFQLKAHLKNETGWDDFLIHFEKANYGFLKTLKEKHPSLNTNDIRFVSYLYMNLSIKEIAALMEQNEGTIKSRIFYIKKEILMDKSHCAV